MYTDIIPTKFDSFILSITDTKPTNRTWQNKVIEYLPLFCYLDTNKVVSNGRVHDYTTTNPVGSWLTTPITSKTIYDLIKP